jgi:peptidyl-prolyl cis-trans isomerase SurA
MKKLLLLFLFFAIISSVHSQTLFTYGNQKVSANEFLNAYNKNKSDTADNANALRDYLDLYINFKLKVQAAKDLQLDTLTALKSDLQNFRSQIEENYLRDEKALNALINEAFLRSQKDIEVADFFVASNNSGDTLKNFNAINELHAELKTGKDSIEDILQKINKNGVNITKSDLGFITVFSLPYTFENVIYGLKPGESSAPLRTKNGWHILKNIAERPAVGKLKVAQILFALPEGASDELRKQTKKIADSVYGQIKNGADFYKMVKEFSDDRTTYSEGGNIEEFGVGKYDPSFEKFAFSLLKDSAVSEPFETKYGFHILKRISATPVPANKTDEAFMADLKEKVLNDGRIEVAKKIFISEILPKTGFKKNKINEPELWKITDSALIAGKNLNATNINEKTVLFSFNNNSKVAVSDWIQFVKNTNKTPEQLHDSYEKLFQEFISFSVIQNYKNRLQDFNPDFKEQLNEFKDGNLLFEIMQRKVWDKAASDSAGLLNFYNQHKEKYTWNKSADAIIFSANNVNTATNAIQILAKGNSWKDVINEYPSALQADSARFELAQLPVNNSVDFSEGLITDPVINKNDGTVVFVKIIKLYPENQQRNFEDARGIVTNDYQSFLEKKWIVELKKQYPVHIDEKVFSKLLRQQ